MIILIYLYLPCPSADYCQDIWLNIKSIKCVNVFQNGHRSFPQPKGMSSYCLSLFILRHKQNTLVVVIMCHQTIIKPIVKFHTGHVDPDIVTNIMSKMVIGRSQYSFLSMPQTHITFPHNSHVWQRSMDGSMFPSWFHKWRLFQVTENHVCGSSSIHITAKP